MNKHNKLPVYLLFAFLPAWTMWGVMGLFSDRLSQLAVTGIMALSMWVPGAAVLITKRLTGGERVMESGFRPRFRGNLRWYLLAWLFPCVFTLVGGAAYFLVFPERFDPGMANFRMTLEAAQPGLEITSTMLWWVLLSQIAVAILLAPLLNTLFALGEEIGWRGLLFPAISAKTSPWQAHLLCGLIWGLWHAPILTMGHNYGVGYPGYPWLGILSMCLFCTGFGAVLSFVTTKSGSIWPAALGHGALNAVAGLPSLFLLTGLDLFTIGGPAIVGIVPAIPLLLFAAVLVVIQSRHTPRDKAPKPQI